MKKNSQGFTLVELVASITLLGLIVVTLLPFFPQMLKWSKVTEDQLVTDHLLSKVAYDLKNDTELGVLQNGSLHLDDDRYEYLVDDATYKPIVKLTQTKQEKDLALFRAHISIANKDTYIYLKDLGAENE